MKTTRVVSTAAGLAWLAAAPVLAQNLALGKPATGSAPCNSDEGPAKAVNGSVSGGNTDKWCSQAASKWLQVDLGSSLTVGRFVVKHASAGGESTAFNTRDFNVQVSTNQSVWLTVVTASGNTAGTTSHVVAAQSARYVRLNVTLAEQASNVTARVYELEVYPPAGATPTPTPTPSSANLALNKPATSSAPCNANEAAPKAVNGSVSGGNSDKWCSLAAAKWLQVDLGASSTVGRFVVKHAGAGGESATFNTRDFNLQTSSDGASFTTVATAAGNTASTSTHPIALRTARYVRLNVIAGDQAGGGAARIYELEVYSSGGGLPTPTPTPTPTPGGGTPPPSTVSDWIGGHGVTMTRLSFDANTALYVDANVNTGVIGWLQPFLTQMFNYCAQTYDPVHTYGPDHLFMFAHQGQFGGGTISSYFDSFSSFRNALDVGADSWARADNINIDRVSHEMAHIVEGSSNGIHESPAFEVWRDSKWAEIFQYDVYRALGMTADADRVRARFISTQDSFPRAGTFWFRDWFLPIYEQNGGAPMLSRFFQLLAQHFPKVSENGGRNLTYARRMNLGELVHFYSGAARTDLKPRATAAFGWTSTTESQWQQARSAFPGVTALY
jgi:hypothetical protein